MECNLISLFKLLAFSFNIILIVCAIVYSSTRCSTIFIIEIYCAQNSCFYVTVSDSNYVE